ncbi:MAG: MotA/TolQ/ExbB proton channel family protein [Polyangiaceae bacterium]|jgi:biopolymer transport protein ExbB|nr:MotA/TolQ/ExbB proton channel family protein [Polyangiaceae bacterium]
MDIIERLLAISEYGSRWVMWLLIALSIAALAVMIERAVLFISSRDDTARLRGELRRLLRENDLELARRRLEESPSFEARVAAAGLEADGVASAEERMQGETELCKLSMEKNLALLGTLGNNAPFIGLLGTVIGIVRSFRELQSSSGQVSAGLMSEIGEALVATAIGLLVALPAVAAFNMFQRLIRARVGRATVMAHEILAYLKARPSAAE